MIAVGDGSARVGAQDASIRITSEKVNVTNSQREGVKVAFLLMEPGHRSTAIFRAPCYLQCAFGD